MFLRFSLLAATSAALLSHASWADQLDDVTVTANRVPQVSGDTLASVMVITHQQIQRSQATSIVELLQGTAGIAFANSGGLGKNSSLFLRGTESDHVAVLIDGIKIGSATSGQAAFAQIPLAQVERIEIVRGARSSLYGSEAIGGVIQLFTRKGGGELKPNLSLGIGSDNTSKTSVGISGGGNQAWFSGQVSRLATQGFNSCRGATSAGCFTDEPDDDGYRQLSGQLRAGYRFDNETEVDVHWLRSQGDVDFDGSFLNQSETTNQVLGLGLHFVATDSWDVSLKAGRSWDDVDSFLQQEKRSEFNTERDTLSWQNDISVREDDLLTVGIDYLNDKISSSTAYPVTSRDNIGIFAQYLTGWGNNEWQLSLRHDDNEQFGQQVTGNISWGYHLSKTYQIVSAFGTAFKAPNFNELYYPSYSNPNLNPEKSRNVELGLYSNNPWGQWGINLFQTQIKDLIAYDTRVSAPNNIQRARIRGLELTASAQWQQWTVKTDVTLLDPVSLNDNSDDTVLPRRAKQSLGLHIDRALNKVNLGSSIYAMGKRYDNMSNTDRLAGYMRWDLRAGYQLSPAWQLQARINNVLDKSYETAKYYNQAGRGYFLNLTYQP